MQTSRSSSVPTAPRLLLPLVHLLRWIRNRLAVVLDSASGARRASLELGSALLLVGVVAAVAMLGMNPLLTVGGGLGLAVLFVVARSWIVAREQPSR